MTRMRSHARSAEDDCALRGQEVQLLKIAAQDIGRRSAKPVLENSGIHRTEVDAESQVAIIEIVEFRMVSIESAAHGLSDDKHRPGGAVVRSLATVLFDAPTNFRR